MTGMRYQPQGLARLNRAHPWASSITGLWLFNKSFRNLVAPRRAPAISGAPVFEAHPGGVGVVGTAGSRINTGSTASQLGINGARKRTILVDYVHTDTSNLETILSLGGNGGTGQGFQLHKSGFQVLSLGGWFADFSNVTVTPGYRAHRVQLALTYDGERVNIYSLASAGESVGRFSESKVLALNTSDANPLCFLSSPYDNKGQFLSRVNSAVVVSDRVLSVAEIEAHFAQPFAIIASPNDDDDWGLADTAASYALSVGRAALAMDGGLVGMRVSRRLAVGPVGLTATARAVRMLAARRLGVHPAALAIEGETVAARVARRITVQSADLAIGAGSTQMLAARRLGIQPAALAVAGQGVAVVVGRRMQISPAPMALAAGTVAMQYSPALVPGAYTLPVSVAAVRLGGGAVGMRVSRRLAVVGAQLQLAAGAARALVGRRLVVAPASLAMTAGPAGARAARRVRVSAAQLVIAGGNVQLRYSSQVEYARAPVGAGYTPQRAAISVRPAQTGGHRPPATQETTR